MTNSNNPRRARCRDNRRTLLFSPRRVVAQQMSLGEAQRHSRPALPQALIFRVRRIALRRKTHGGGKLRFSRSRKRRVPPTNRGRAVRTQRRASILLRFDQFNFQFSYFPHFSFPLSRFFEAGQSGLIERLQLHREGVIPVVRAFGRLF